MEWEWDTLFGHLIRHKEFVFAEEALSVHAKQQSNHNHNHIDTNKSKQRHKKA